MSRPRVVLTNRVHPETVGLLEERCMVVANQSDEPLERDELVARARRASALMVFMTDCLDDRMLAGCPELRIVAGALKGPDNFDVEACTRRGVWFTVVSDLLSAPTAELAVGLLIALLRRLPEGDRHVRSGAFRGWRPILYGRTLQGATVGLIGMGGVGRELTERLRPFGARVIFTDPALEDASNSHGQVELDELLHASDVVIPLTPLTSATHHLLDARALAALKPGSIVVNVGRGSIVDENAVADALESGRLAGYAADVFAMEDWAQTNRPRAIDSRLRQQVDQTLFTPHLGSAVAGVRRQIELEAAGNILEALQGRRPRGAINELAISQETRSRATSQ